MKISNVLMGICKSKNIHYNGQDKKNKGKTMIYKILHIKLNIERHESIEKIRM
jgi:hypothetical protein